MIQMQTSLEVADNSGARRVEMIMGIGGSTGVIASLGDRIKVTVKEASPDGAVKKGTVQDAVIVRVDRLVLHTKYRRYVRRTSKFMAHDDLGATTGDRVRIVETRPLSAKKRWRVVEIVQKAAK